MNSETYKHYEFRCSKCDYVVARITSKNVCEIKCPVCGGTAKKEEK